MRDNYIRGGQLAELASKVGDKEVTILPVYIEIVSAMVVSN